MVYSMAIYHSRTDTTSMTGMQFFPPKSQDILLQFSMYTAGLLDPGFLGRKAYLQRSTGIGVRERETFMPVSKSAFFALG